MNIKHNKKIEVNSIGLFELYDKRNVKLMRDWHMRLHIYYEH
jgi:hypothetical protein